MANNSISLVNPVNSSSVVTVATFPAAGNRSDRLSNANTLIPECEREHKGNKEGVAIKEEEEVRGEEWKKQIKSYYHSHTREQLAKLGTHDARIYVLSTAWFIVHRSPSLRLCPPLCTRGDDFCMYGVNGGGCICRGRSRRRTCSCQDLPHHNYLPPVLPSYSSDSAHSHTSYVCFCPPPSCIPG